MATPRCNGLAGSVQRLCQRNHNKKAKTSEKPWSKLRPEDFMGHLSGKMHTPSHGGDGYSVPT